MKTNNPHDITFRDIFSDVKRAKELIEVSLPKEVTELFDWATLSNEEESFVDENLREYFSDILFSIELKTGDKIKIYLLFEHKSYGDNSTWIQLFGYMSKIYQKLKEAVVVIPLVFYHGEKQWKLAKNFADSLKLPEDVKAKLSPYIPNFEYALLDLTQEDVEKMLISLTMKAVFYTFRNMALLGSLWVQL